MNHCGQSPSGFWLRKTRSSRSRTGSQRPEREQQLDRALADVARAPAAARVLLEPARREVVDQRVVREPGQDLLRAARRRRRAALPPRGCSVERARACRARSGCARVPSRRGSRSRTAAARPRDELTRDAQARRDATGAVTSTRKGWPRERPSANSSSSPPDALERRARLRDRCGSSRPESAGRHRCRAAQRTATPSLVAHRRAAGRASAPSSPPSATWCETRKRHGAPSTHVDARAELVALEPPPSCAPRSRPPRAGRSSGSRSASSRTPRARRAAASRPPSSTKMRSPCERKRPR